jgi:hypothetical protein
MNSSESWAWWFKPVILANCEVNIRRIVVWGQPRQKECKTPFHGWARWHMPVISATQGRKNRGSWWRLALGIR